MTAFNDEDKVVLPTESVSEGKDGKVFLVLGWVFAVISLLLLPILFGPLGIFFGHLAGKNGRENQGKNLMIAASILMVLGFVFGMLTYILIQSNKTT